MQQRWRVAESERWKKETRGKRYFLAFRAEFAKFQDPYFIQDAREAINENRKIVQFPSRRVSDAREEFHKYIRSRNWYFSFLRRLLVLVLHIYRLASSLNAVSKSCGDDQKANIEQPAFWHNNIILYISLINNIISRPIHDLSSLLSSLVSVPHDKSADSL